MTKIIITLDSSTFLMLGSLCQFYHKSESEVVDMALTQLATQARLVEQVVEAKERHKH